jgi:macrodomain Ter protein organizer (MatP/YcbG family)
MNNTPQYPLSESDFAAARAYVQRKLPRQPHWLEHRQAESEWYQARHDRLTFQRWCERWLDGGQWRLLQQAVRSARQRQRASAGSHPRSVTVSLSRHAWYLVSTLAEQDGLSLSEWLIRRHQSELPPR